MKVYILTGYDYEPEVAYATREEAEKAAKEENYYLSCAGSYNTVEVVELMVV